MGGTRTIRAAASLGAVAAVVLAAAGCDQGRCCCQRSAPLAPVAPDTPAAPLKRARWKPSPGSVPATAATPGKPLRVSGTDYKGVIFAMSPEEIAHWEATAFWTPTAEDVRRLEAALPAALRAAAPMVKTPLKEYFRQYLGVVREGRRLVLVFAIHEPSLEEIEEELLKEPRLVNDGGDAYIDGVYDAAKGTFESVGPHGEA